MPKNIRNFGANKPTIINMKNLLRSIALALLTSVAITTAAATPFDALCIERTDGVMEYLKLDPDMKVKFLPEMIQIVHPQITVEYKLDEVADFKFGNNDAVKLYEGTHKAGLDEIISDKEIGISAEEITVSGSDDVAVYDLRGVEQARATSDGTHSSLRISSLPKGVYILRTGNTVLKIRI